MAVSRDNKTISDFKSRLLGGGARPNLFEVELTGMPASVALPWQAERFGSYVRQHRCQHKPSLT